MNMLQIFQIAGIGIVVAIFYSILKEAKREELAQLLAISGVALVTLMVLRLISDLFDQVRSVFSLY
ncbi:stage III sporulation protein AC [Heliobacterium undosum]|uniref:Stage iii sporulation protein ac, putative n=3 Tax=Heliomicrobium TaxID=2831443 RepID=B0TEH6_HELMI|nr:MULTISPECIES: stage III sporulation protein AC [Heliomicrobium]ABZ82895.1 stage iii sporulation protein ac, putative [Heliomicrobium modesticaldum Ice1]MBM7867915.1 stage III sporulation protein AC [Heliomicrobium gestii]MZP28468.1 stage III sporulation protein AC [Heliomicrobium undosum]MZP43274.1 stage III sporulation protein AC [Heliomicrobium gestii]